MPGKLCILFILLPAMASAQCLCGSDPKEHDESEAIRYKLASFASVMVAGAVGVSLPLLGKKLPALQPENDIFFMIKAFAAGVILATGFIHILPDAFSNLSSPCLSEQPWGKFPFAGFVAMLFSIGTLTVDTLATGFYKRQHFVKSKQVVLDEEIAQELASHVHVHTHATHGHAHGSASADGGISLPELIRRRIISQVLEVGIVVHSVIIGVSLGTSQTPATIKALLVALSFHQFFEGMGLGSCISQAEFKSRSTAIMATFFSVTTPVGIAIGIGISSFYEENNPRAVMVEGILESGSAGILIYMALVDLLAADFMNPRMQAKQKLQLGAHASLLLGAGCMSVLAKWA